HSVQYNITPSANYVQGVFMQSRVGGDTPSRRVQSALAGGQSDAIVTVNMTRRYLSAMLLAVAVTAAAPINPARAQFAAPSFIDFDWTDSARSRTVPARLHWPTNIAPGSRVPLIVFSHGMGGSRRGYSYLGRYWAARGIAS